MPVARTCNNFKFSSPVARKIHTDTVAVGSSDPHPHPQQVQAQCLPTSITAALPAYGLLWRAMHAGNARSNAPSCIPISSSSSRPWEMWAPLPVARAKARGRERSLSLLRGSASAVRAWELNARGKTRRKVGSRSRGPRARATSRRARRPLRPRPKDSKLCSSRTPVPTGKSLIHLSAPIIAPSDPILFPSRPLAPLRPTIWPINRYFSDFLDPFRQNPKPDTFNRNLSSSQQRSPVSNSPSTASASTGSTSASDPSSRASQSSPSTSPTSATSRVSAPSASNGYFAVSGMY